MLQQKLTFQLESQRQTDRQKDRLKDRQTELNQGKNIGLTQPTEIICTYMNNLTKRMLCLADIQLFYLRK